MNPRSMVSERKSSIENKPIWLPKGKGSERKEEKKRKEKKRKEKKEKKQNLLNPLLCTKPQDRCLQS